MADTMEKQWHYAKNGQTGGPVAESTLFDMIAAGELGPKDHVWNPECADWLPIERSPFAKACGKPAPPAAPASSGGAGPGSAYGSSAQSMQNAGSPVDNPGTGAASSAWGASSRSAQSGASSSAASAWEKFSSGEGRAQRNDWQSAQSAYANPRQEGGEPSGQRGQAYGQGAGQRWGAPTSGPMGFVDAVKVCLTKKFATFSGRASRSEFWWFTLFHWLCAAAASILGNLFGGFETANAMQGLVSLALLLPGLAVFVRRMHDINKSGWFYLLILIPIVGWIILLIWLCRPSDQTPNRFGA